MDAAGAAASAAVGLLMGEKAKLECVGDNMPDGDVSIECMFNPEKYKLSQTVGVSFSDTPSTPGGSPDYTGTKAMTLSVTLFFDDFGSVAGDVTPKITALLRWTRPTRASLAGTDPRPCPPLIQFVWGGNPQLSDFQGYLTSVDVTYTVFRKDGTPVRAEVGITLTGRPVQPPKKGQNPTSRATNTRRVHTVIEGDSLPSIASRELGKPRYWRAIAELNGIDDPARLPAGSVLLMPSVADAARDA